MQQRDCGIFSGSFRIDSIAHGQDYVLINTSERPDSREGWKRGRNAWARVIGTFELESAFLFEIQRRSVPSRKLPDSRVVEGGPDLDGKSYVELRTRALGTESLSGKRSERTGVPFLEFLMAF